MDLILVPLDNRPVTYLLPEQILRLAGISCSLPPRSLLGSLNTEAQVDVLNTWLQNKLSERPDSPLILCIDTLTYGGLINSRRSSSSETVIQEQVKILETWKTRFPQRQILAQSSILRVSDNYDNTEEKEYWARFGREIYQWSEILHKVSKGIPVPAETIQTTETRIPLEIRKDYLAMRRRNFKLNTKLVDYVEKGILDFLILSQDDSGTFGLNVLEKDKLLQQAEQIGVREKIASYPGSDETILTLITRTLMDNCHNKPSVAIRFNDQQGKTTTCLYEGQSLENSIKGQICAAGLAETTETDQADIVVLVHSPVNAEQGDHIHIPGLTDRRHVGSEEAAKKTIAILETIAGPVVIVDAVYANGADPLLIDMLLSRPELLQKLHGYAGWNTTGNSAGCALAMGAATWFAQQNHYQYQAHLKSLLFIRLADDWAYQTVVRQNISANPSSAELSQGMAPHLERIARALEFTPGPVRVSSPWNRKFEVEVQLPATARV